MNETEYTKCPEIDNGCSMNHNVDMIHCYENYEACNEWFKRKEHRKTIHYGIPLGIGAMSCENIIRLIEKIKP